MGEYIIIKKDKFDSIFKRFQQDYPSFCKENETMTEYKKTYRHYLDKRITSDIISLRENLING